ncbi:mucin-17 [Anopheles cruzii]|uniref:mucin-17 n=1 Tax=Anopheles cruzii TaxID=68878 RepID=UPI0022EC2342|nr:mucin-17 [Anopheles cruzii]
MALALPAEAGERWSRQLTEFSTGGGGVVTGPGNDWVPLSRPIDRQSGARVLSYFTAPGGVGHQQAPAFLGPDNVAQAQQHHFTFLNHQFPQSNRFVLQSQPQQPELQPFPHHLSSQPTFHHQRAGPAFVGQTIQHPPPPPPPVQSSANPFEQQFFPKSEALPLTQDDKPSADQPFSYQHIRQPPELEPTGQRQPPAPVSQEEVQLLYVPVETLFNQKTVQEPSSPASSLDSGARFNTLPHPVSPSLINDFYTASTATTATVQQQQQTAPTAATKPKPNQPPLALFLYNDGRQNKLSTGDALGGLKNVNEIAVLDSVGKNSPKVFIGPAGLTPPKSYSRFDLPYLSSVDGLAAAAGRANRKFEDHPFYVAPLSHKTPAGYSKIALPAPHVGSVIVRQQPAGNALAPDQTPFYTRPTPAQSHVQYYTPSTLNFGEPVATTKQPADHYSSPTGRPTTTQSVATQSSPPDGRSVSQYNSFSAAVPTRHHSTASAVNEEYFNLAKTKKPVPTTNGPFRSGTGVTRQFDFKPMPEQRIPTAYDPDLTTPITTTPITTTFLTTTTEKPTTIEQRLQQLEADRMRTHFREENFRSRHRPYQHQPAAAVSTERTYEDGPAKQTHFVHKFKLVDSVRPSAQTKSLVDSAFLEFFSPRPSTPVEDTDQMLRTTVTAFLPSSSSGHERQAIRNNYYNAIGAGHEEQTGTGQRQKFVNTYYTSAEPGSRSTTAGTVAPPTVAPSSTLSTQDAFFREFEQKSKFFEREPKYRTQFGGQELGSTGGPGAYINKYRYETDFTDSPPRYSVKVITTGEPTTTVEPVPATEQYGVPSELPPISANLPGLVNALMDDQWAGRPANGRTTTNGDGVTRVPHSRKHRPTTTPSDDDTPVTTTRRPLQRGRRPHPSRTTPAPDAAGDYPSSTRAPSQRSRSRYVPNNDERPIGRTRSRSRPNTPRPAAPKQDLDYQRDVLKQNYPVIRPQSAPESTGESVATTPTTTTTTTVAPPTTTPSSTTLLYRDAYEDQTDRLIATTLINEVPLGPEQHEVTRKYSTYFSEEPYEPDVTATTASPPQTTNYFRPASTEPEPEYPSRSREVIPLDHSVIPLSRPTEAPRQTSSFYTEADSDERNYSREPTGDGVMELKKVETPVRPGRRPNLLARQPYAGRSTTERTTTVRTTTSPAAAEPVRSSGRRPAFVRRPSRLYAATTTVSPPTTTSPNADGAEQPTQGSYALRTKNRQDILRGRTRQRPTTTTTPPPEPIEPNAATAASPDTSSTRGFGRAGNLRRTAAGNLRSRQEPTAPPTTQQPPVAGPRFRIRERTRFTLQPQESQWSTKLNQNSFQPVLKPATHTTEDEPEEPEDVSHEPETEIVTAVSPDSEMYFVNVTSNLNQKGSEEDSHAEDSTENSSVPSFADLLNDVMKDFIKDGGDTAAPKKTESQPSVTVAATPSKVAEKVEEAADRDRTSSSFRNNFLRKRSRPRVIDSFEAAESQHIDRHATQTLNGAGPHLHYPVKNIDRATLPLAKNDLEGNERENTAQEESTAAPTAQDDETTTDEVPTLVPDLPEDPSSNPTADSQPTANGPTDESVPTVASSTTGGASGIFDDVKKQLSDLYQMAENDPETEEVVDREDDPLTGAEHPDDLLPDVPTTEETGPAAAAEAAGVEYLGDDKRVISTGVDMAPSETEYAPVLAVADPMGSLVIPTSVSNGITHETEICYRGRCIKTEDDDRTKAKDEP